MLLFVLAACRDPEGQVHTVPAEDVIEEIGGPEGPFETGDPEEPEFFDDTVIHTIAITLSDDSRRDLSRDPYEYVDAAVVVDGASFPHVGVRLRGKIGSFRDLDGKPKFKIDFNQFVDQRLGDHESLALNNEVVDCSYLREPAGYAVFRQLGLPAPRTAYTSVTVNGEPYGLYVAVEFPDDRFLDRQYADGGGNLYDGKYKYYESGSYALIDFRADMVENFQLEEGSDVDLADVLAITDAAAATGTFAERFEPLLDTAQFHRHIAAEQWIGHLDGYATNTNNYRVYFDPEDGRADLLTYDHDYAFYAASAWGMSWAQPAGVLVSACWQDTECVEAHRAAVSDIVAEIDTDALLAQLEGWIALTADAVSDDPRRECQRRQIGPEQAEVVSWVTTGSDDLAAYWAR